MSPKELAKLEQADWNHPWWENLRPRLEVLLAKVLAGDALHDALNSVAEIHGQDVPIRFVPQTALPEGMAYEQFIYDQQRVPVRETVHDFFHGLMWMQWPQSKLRMNQLQAHHIAEHGVQGTRGALRDALTILDESGLVLMLPSDVLEDLRERRWRQALFDKRELWEQGCVQLVGHAVYEKLLTPYKSIIAHVWGVASDSQGKSGADIPSKTALDALLAASLSKSTLVPKPFYPLPVLGIPAWWEANTDGDFYADSRVFRPLKPTPCKEA